MNDLLLPPRTAQLHEYFGWWGIEMQAGEGLRHLTRSEAFASQVHAFSTSGRQIDIPLKLLPGRGKSSVALVPVLGVMMKGQSWFGTSTVAVRHAIRQAAADPSVSGILLAIDSPGGHISGTADLASDIRAVARKKPIYGHIQDNACSCAYWVGSQCDMLFANNSIASVGNVGNYIMMQDSSGAAEMTGVKEIAIKSGPLKVFGGGLGISDEQAAVMQGLVDGTQVEFLAAIKRVRDLSDTKLKEISSGAVYLASKALELGLINGVQSFEKTFDQLASVK